VEREPNRDARVDALLEGALDQPVDERAAWLAGRCGGDAELAAEVARLAALSEGELDELVAPVHAFAAEALDEPAARAAAPGRPLAAGERIGAWTITGTLGRGGMGIVYAAERSHGGFLQRAAVKVLPHAASSPDAVRRFERERRILARLAHPHIAHLVDGGIDARGLPYLVLERVDGEPVDAYSDRLRLPLESRLRLVVEIATALQAAHARLVVHRDIKPSNVLVTAAGDVKLLDFGIAKLLDPEEADDELVLTATEGRPMTPTYASPEQVTGASITTASDVYQLGLLIYELVTGRRPQASRTSSLAELVDLICRREPDPPSRAALVGEPDEVAARAALRGTTPARLARRCRPELDAIVARALAKEPERRYPAAIELAEDLERFLAGRPVRARRATLRYRAAKWMRRNAALATAAAVASLLTFGYAVAVTLQARAIDRQRERAELEAAKAAEVERFVLDLFRSSDPAVALGRDTTARELLARGAERLERELAGQPEVQARLGGTLAEIYGRLDLVAEGRALVEQALARQRALHGDRHPEVADSWRRLGVLLRLDGDDAGSAAALREAVGIRRRLVPLDEAGLAHDLGQLGESVRRTGDLTGAEAAYGESLELRRARGDRAGVADSLTNLASLHYSARDYARAERLNREALALLVEARGERHPDTAIVRFNLGLSLRRSGRDAEALAELERALEIHREIYGEEHFTTLWTRLERAMALQQAGDLARAEAELAAVVPALAAKLGPDDPRVADAEFSFGMLRYRQRRFAEAEPHYRAALAGLERRYGAAHYRLTPPSLWLGRTLRELGREPEAVELWRAARGMVRPGADDRLAADLDTELARSDP
jgi:serine/threonine-protein kinase